MCGGKRKHIIFISLFSWSIVAPAVWYASKVITMLMFLWLAKRWPRLMVYWESIDRRISAYNTRGGGDDGDEQKNHHFHRLIKFTTIIIFALFFGIYIHTYIQYISIKLFRFKSFLMYFHKEGVVLFHKYILYYVYLFLLNILKLNTRWL